MDETRVGVVGLGTIGAAVADRLLEAGYEVVGYDRADAAVGALAAAGGTPASSPADVAARVDLLLSSLPDASAVREVYLGTDGVVEGADEDLAAVDLSTVGPGATRELADAAPDLAFLESPISGGVERARAGTLTLMVGGPETVLRSETVRPVLDAMADDVVHCGDVGAAGTVKVLHNQIAIGTRLVFLEAAGVAAREGVDWETFLDVVTSPASMAGSNVFEAVMPLVLDRSFEGGFSVELSKKDLGLALDLAEDAGAPVPIAAQMYQLHAAAVEEGLAGANVAAMVELFEPPDGPTVSWDDG